MVQINETFSVSKHKKLGWSNRSSARARNPQEEQTHPQTARRSQKQRSPQLSGPTIKLLWKKCLLKVSGVSLMETSEQLLEAGADGDRWSEEEASTIRPLKRH